MVITHKFTYLFDMCSQTRTLSLPVYKENNLKFEIIKCDDCSTVYEGLPPALPFANGELFNASISNWRKLTPDDEGCKHVYEVTFDITGSSFYFKPGDTIGVVPRNPDQEVNLIINHLDLSDLADLPYTLSVDKSQKGAKILPHIPVKSTLRHILTHCLDIRCVVKKLFILALSRHTNDEKEQKVLEYLCSKEGAEIYTTHILNKNICILDLFTMFQTCKPPIEVLLAHLPRLLPRPYSIANSNMKNKNILNICFSVIDIGNNRKGLTTSWLQGIITASNMGIENRLNNLSIDSVTERSETYNQDKIPIYLRKNISGFSMPENLDKPLLLLGPGTGVAPFIGFLQERQILKENVPEFNLGPTWLFFGCRNPNLDYIYKTELEEFVTKGILNKLDVAFSRLEKSDTRYIQDALMKNGEEVTKFIIQGASVFICGDLKSMVLQIKEVLVQCLVQYDSKSSQEAEKYICDMHKEKRYFVDAWN